MAHIKHSCLLPQTMWLQKCNLSITLTRVRTLYAERVERGDLLQQLSIKRYDICHRTILFYLSFHHLPEMATPVNEWFELAIQPLRRWFWCTKQQRIELLLAVCQYDMNIQLNLFWRASSWGTSYQSPVFTVIMIVMLNSLIFFLNLLLIPKEPLLSSQPLLKGHVPFPPRVSDHLIARA